MKDAQLSRRNVLSAIVVAGGSGSLVGAGTGALFTDEEVFTNNAVRASTDVGGVVDLDVTVEDLSNDRDGVRYPITLPLAESATTTNNPAYIWFRTLECPTSEGSLDDIEIRITVSDGEGNSEVLGEGRIPDVLDDLRTGTPVVPVAEDPCLQPGKEWVVEVEVTETPHDEPISFGLEFYAQQCRYQSGTTNPWDESDVIAACEPTDGSKHAISFIAFCASDGLEGAIDEADLTVTKWKDETGTEPLTVEWESDEAVETIVVKAGKGMENFYPGGATSGTVEAGGGEPAGGSQSPPDPCPSGSGLKFEFVDGAFQKEAN
ncbi:SipW-dependent-type signal peptide-containing protein [Halobaculum gomorrense]|uniref:SipW-cognate class signal peptide n=1 Tax=Halobaculum gomorrense TaxID=43928 RepID=A0A1M5UF08_9EURY|nr:SipW-dependent-type signal peptide-containing protein [Halobaculum gomorrense]SHH61520.1 SipW-cognate class signal peptide [Halobaculum gomorrense]